MNNIDGFMNMDTYLSEKGITKTAQEQDSEKSRVVESLGSEAAHDEHVRQQRDQKSEKVIRKQKIQVN